MKLDLRSAPLTIVTNMGCHAQKTRCALTYTPREAKNELACSAQELEDSGRVTFGAIPNMCPTEAQTPHSLCTTNAIRMRPKLLQRKTKRTHPECLERRLESSAMTLASSHRQHGQDQSPQIPLPVPDCNDCPIGTHVCAIHT